MVGITLPWTQSLERPAWLDALLSLEFFVPCKRHSIAKKNERNIFCIDCQDAICQHCLGGHGGHKLVQVRRYVYHDVVRLNDISKLVDCSGVQTYIINGARVVFLNQRPQPKPSKALGNVCGHCDRALQEPHHYCCVACKVDSSLEAGQDVSSMLPKFMHTTFELSPESSPMKHLKAVARVTARRTFKRLARSPSESSFQSQSSEMDSPRDAESDTSSTSLPNIFEISPRGLKRSRGSTDSLDSVLRSISRRKMAVPIRSPLW